MSYKAFIRKNIKKHTLVCLSFASSIITILSGIVLTSSTSSAASASTATATVKIAASCTLSGGGNYSATVPNGTSAEIAGSTLTVTCNDAGGFALYAVGNSGDEYGNNNMIGPSVNIPSDTTSAGSYWAMKITPTTGNTPTIENAFDSFKNVPIVHTKVASYSGSTGTGSLSVDATYKANISSTQLAGNYLGKVKYTLIHPSSGDAPVTPLAASDCPANSICYAPNADDIEGTMLSTELSAVAASPRAGRQIWKLGSQGSGSITADSTAQLIAYNYSRPGYGFAGWSPSYEASTASGSTDIIFGPQATISTYPDNLGGVDVDTNGLILYPVWVASTGSMQTFSSSDCNAMSISDVTARKDIRDDNVYTIAKLADGKCWMVENLRLDNDANITPANTHSTNNAFGGVFTGLAKPEKTDHPDATPNSLYSTDGTTVNVITGGTGHRMPRYNNTNTDRSLPASYTDTHDHQWYGFGNYYTWPAAIADTSYYNTNNQPAETSSLCPTGWRLPRGGNKSNEANNEFWSLVVTSLNNGINPSNYSSSTYPYYTGSAEVSPVYRALRAYPNNFLLSGYISSSIIYKGRHGYYWTSTAWEQSEAYDLHIYENYVYPGSRPHYNYKYQYRSIRCLVGN